MMKYTRLKKSATEKEKHLLDLKPGDNITLDSPMGGINATVLENDISDDMDMYGLSGSVTVQLEYGQVVNWDWTNLMNSMVT